MKILIYGTGGVGGYFGARLAEAGNDITFIARGKHLEIIQKKGLKLKSIDGNFTIFPVKANNSVSDLDNNFDLIILGVKSWQITEVAKTIKPVLAENTMILPLQNGVDIVEKLLSVIDKKHILAGFCKIYSKVENYGIIEHFAHPPELLLGELDNKITPRLTIIKNAFDKAKFKTTIPDDIHAEIWKKFMFICTISGLGALTRVSIGEMVENKETRILLKKTAKEIHKIAIAKSIDLPNNIVESIMNFIDNQSYESTASMQRDIMNGRPSELENFYGYIVKQGVKFGIKTPVNKFVYGCLLPQENKARK